ncbi:NUDIX domain-containing protein [Psychrobacter sp. S1-30-MNA-CIBAN-0213]|uniref:NUDIX domain-containing protein n=1 Tax=unclassified Psychrobacter TaxID=196806 RepID=UPI00331933CE
MPNQSDKQSKNIPVTIVNVAIAVIHYKDKYLLGFRDALQHQGNRYEFVGGKIDNKETAKQALIREVAEETGIEISDNTIVKLGRLHHDYGNKQVSLQVYNIELTTQQYEKYKPLSYGLEGQALTWVNKSELLAGNYNLPAANKTILEWLRLHSKIVITYPLAHFSTNPDPAAAWLQFHQKHLAEEAWVYIRVKDASSENMAEQLMRSRPDIFSIMPHNDDCHYLTTSHQIIAYHLTHTALIQWFNAVENNSVSGQLLPPSHSLIISCHDADSIYAANKLASARLEQQLPPIIGIFLSPVLATQTHSNATPLGWEEWSALAVLADMPVIGLGGLSPTLLEQATHYGATSIAGIRHFL